MNGSVTLSFQDQVRTLHLNKAASVIGSAPVADLQVPSPGVEPHHCALAWEPRAATWMLSAPTSASQKTLRLNGAAFTHTSPLADGDIMELPGVVIRFSLVAATPRFQGHEANEVLLKGHPSIVLGRASGEASSLPKLELDGEDTRISRTHVVIDQTPSGGVFASDKSQTDTFLNGQRFDRRQLVVGDRLRLGSYTFEFTGASLRRVSAHRGTKIEARHVSFSAGGRIILGDVSLDVLPGSFVGIFGGPGQGKSLLMDVLRGAVPPTKGKIYINGVRLGSRHEMRGIGYVPLEDIVHPELTVWEAIYYRARLELPASTPAKAIRELVSETIDRLNLAERKNTRIELLPAGARKRVSIAAELLARPSVLFLEEPNKGLDPSAEIDLMSMLSGADSTVICTTPMTGRAHLFDQLCFMHGGQLIFHGRLNEAARHFKVDGGLEEIYLKVSGQNEKTAAQWRQEFEACHPAAMPLAYPTSVEPSRTKRTKLGRGWLRTCALLLQRQWSIFKSRRLYPLPLLVWPLVIGALIGWVSGDAVLRGFLCLAATLWFGCANGAPQIVREKGIVRSEQSHGWGISAYLASKYAFSTLVTTVQTALLFLAMLTSAHLLHPPQIKGADYLVVFGASLGLKIAALFTNALVGVAVGLAISAWARDIVAAFRWIPLVILPQILLGGVFVSPPEMSASVRVCSEYLPLSQAQRVMSSMPSPALPAFCIIGGWIMACCGLAFFGLSRKKKET